MTPDELAETAKATSRTAGCNCDPAITIRQIAPGVHRALIAHDPWCQLLNRRHAERN